MNNSGQWAHHPAVLAAAALLGALMATVFPVVVPLMAMISVAFVALLQMVALPLMAVAVVFGLRRLLELPHPWERTALLLLSGLGLVVLASALGLTAAQFFATVWPTLDADRDRLGTLIHAADQTSPITLGAQAATASAKDWMELIPANVFDALANGRIPAVLLAAVLFGLALHLQGEGLDARSEQTRRSAYALLESVYRSLEIMIERLGFVVPFAAWAMAGHASSELRMAHLSGMAGLVLPLLVCVALWGAAVVMAVAVAARVSFAQALMALGRPMCISLLAAAPGASIASYISALSDRLGYSRGVVELLTPVAPFFVKAGEALYFAVLFVCLCGLYSRPATASDWGLIVTASCWAALISVQLPMGRTLAAGSMGLAWLDLPIDAVTTLLVGLELLTFGLRQLVSDTGACALIAWVTIGTARQGTTLEVAGTQAALGTLVLRAPILLALGVLAATTLLLAFMLGMGLGLRSV